jgi:hypothetical protein
MIELRKKVYSSLSNYNKALSKEGLVYTFDIPIKHLESLRSAALNYLNDSMTEYYKTKFNIKNGEDLQKNIDKVLNMPNITPNGKFLPKNETAKFLNNVQIALIDYIDSIDISKNIKTMQTVNIWIKTFKQDSKFAHRPMYTGRIHSDSWVGHHGDSILWLSPVMGNDNTMEVLEPINPSKNYLTVSNSFEETKKRYTSVEIIGKVKNGKMAIMDHLSLHRTAYKAHSLPRITISCGITMNSEKSLEQKSNKKFRNEFNKSYYPVSTLRKVGKNLTFSVEETLNNCKIKFKNTSIQHIILPNNGVMIKERVNK